MISQYHERKKEEGIRKKEEPVNLIVYRLILAPPVGLEPTTLRLTAACSTD